MNTYGDKGHVQQCWVKDSFKMSLNETDIHNYILQLNFQLVRTNNMDLLKYHCKYLFLHQKYL